VQLNQLVLQALPDMMRRQGSKFHADVEAIIQSNQFWLHVQGMNDLLRPFTMMKADQQHNGDTQGVCCGNEVQACNRYTLHQPSFLGICAAARHQQSIGV